MRKLRRLVSLSCVLLMLFAVGCGRGNAEFMPHDTMDNDTDSTAFFELSQSDEEECLWEEAAGPSVSEITPDIIRSVKEKRAQNPDTVGWLYIPDTDINQVVVQNPVYETNDYYLNISFEGLSDKNGTYCVDRRASMGQGNRWELSRITTIYGHSWDDNPDGELFAQLKNYRDPEFARQHPYIFFSTSLENMAWEVFAVFETGTDLSYNVPGISVNRFYDVLDLIDEASLYNYDIAISPEDKILTLSTCIFSVQGRDNLPEWNEYRFAVMARLVEPDDPLREEAEFYINAAPISPDEISERLNNGAMRIYEFGNIV